MCRGTRKGKVEKNAASYVKKKNTRLKTALHVIFLFYSLLSRSTRHVIYFGDDHVLDDSIRVYEAKPRDEFSGLF